MIDHREKLVYCIIVFSMHAGVWTVKYYIMSNSLKLKCARLLPRDLHLCSPSFPLMAFIPCSPSPRGLDSIIHHKAQRASTIVHWYPFASLKAMLPLFMSMGVTTHEQPCVELTVRRRHEWCGAPTRQFLLGTSYRLRLEPFSGFLY